MNVLATDEAGYGPRLGPLVVGLTHWRIDNGSVSTAEDLATAFENLSRPIESCGTSICVDDSKRIHKSGRGLLPLLIVNSAADRWRGGTAATADQYLRSTVRGPNRGGFDQLINPLNWYSNANEDPAWPMEVAGVIDHWRTGVSELLDIQTSVIPAKHFNNAIETGKNKSDLLGETTLQMVADAVTTLGPGPIGVFCDRLGGRRYYAGLIQHFFPDSRLTIVTETASLSRYRVVNGDQQITIEYTVKGDRFPPVAMSSLVAKLTREILMQRMNQYFGDRKPGLRSTAGYPVDADRFLSETAATRATLKIADADFIRIR